VVYGENAFNLRIDTQHTQVIVRLDSVLNI
jgi:hypothetical protein